MYTQFFENPWDVMAVNKLSVFWKEGQKKLLTLSEIWYFNRVINKVSAL